MTAVQQMLMGDVVGSTTKTVSLRGAGAMVISGAASLAIAVPSAAQVGDLLVAVMMYRSATSTVPSGWTQISAAGPSATTGQYTYVYSKTATSGDISAGSATFTQTTSNRIIGQMLALTATSGTPLLESQSAGVSASVTAATIPSITSLGDGRLGVAAGSFTLALTTPTATSILATNSWTLQSPTLVDQNRLGVATKALNSGANTSGTFTTSAGTGETTQNALIFSPP